MSTTERELVFLSYAHDDKEKVRKVYDGLKERKVNVWFDKENKEPGRWKKYYLPFLPFLRTIIGFKGQASFISLVVKSVTTVKHASRNSFKKKFIFSHNTILDNISLHYGKI